jgi:hypothetical protein
MYYRLANSMFKVGCCVVDSVWAGLRILPHGSRDDHGSSDLGVGRVSCILSFKWQDEWVGVSPHGLGH